MVSEAIDARVEVNAVTTAIKTKPRLYSCSARGLVLKPNPAAICTVVESMLIAFPKPRLAFTGLP